MSLCWPSGMCSLLNSQMDPAAPGAFMRPAQPEAYMAPGGLDATGRHSHSTGQACPALKGKRRALLYITLPEGETLPGEVFSRAALLPSQRARQTLPSNTRLWRFGKEVIKGAGIHECLAAFQSLESPMPGARERHYDAELHSLKRPLARAYTALPSLCVSMAARPARVRQRSAERDAV